MKRTEVPSRALPRAFLAIAAASIGTTMPGATTQTAQAHEKSSSGAAAQSAAGKMPAQTPEQWIALGKRVHGGFGSYIALGIRIGRDAANRLDAGPRDLEVHYISGASAPCPCVADGLMISTYASPGQGSLRVSNAPPSSARAPHMSTHAARQAPFGVAIITSRKSGRALRYVIPSGAQSLLDAANAQPERARFDAIMNAPQKLLFTVQPQTNSPQNANAKNANANATSANATSANATSANATSANATSANATSANATSANATSANATSANATSANAKNARKEKPVHAHN